MASGIELNRNYTDSYMLLPMNRERNGMKVVSQNESKEQSELPMDNLDDLKKADTDENGILTLNELKNCKDKTEFMQMIEDAMQNFINNPTKDYSKNLFEYWV